MSKEVVDLIEKAMLQLQQLSCESPPPNGLTMSDLERMAGTAEELDNPSVVGQYTWLLLKQARDELIDDDDSLRLQHLEDMERRESREESR